MADDAQVCQLLSLFGLGPTITGESQICAYS